MVNIQSRRIVLVGAAGALGSHILEVLLDTAVHHISVHLKWDLVIADEG